MANTKILLLSKIVVDETFNSRKSSAPIESLKRAIEAQGLDNPLTVWERDDGSYFLVAGFRRMRALKELGRKREECTIRHYENVAAAFSANLAENVEREPIRPADAAQAVWKLKTEYGMSAKDIRDHVGIDLTLVYKYQTIESNLNPEILKFWHNPNLPIVLPVEMLMKWAAVPNHEKQLLLMKEWQGDVETAKLMKVPRNSAQKTRSKGDMRAKLLELQERENSEFIRGATLALEWALKEKRDIA